MSREWIKVEIVTPAKPEVSEMAEYLGISVAEVLGRLVMVWAWADQQSLNGHAMRVTNITLSSHAGHTRFAEAMRKVGWLAGDDMALTIPRFERHNGESAKKRALARDRKAVQRSRDGHADTVTRSEKLEVRSKPPISPKGDSPGFIRFWNEWPDSPRKVAKAKCRKTWASAGLEKLVDAIVADVVAKRDSEQWRKGFEPAPTTYLNERRWEDGAPGASTSALRDAFAGAI